MGNYCNSKIFVGMIQTRDDDDNDYIIIYTEIDTHKFCFIALTSKNNNIFIMKNPEPLEA
jgi:hypothetical protein